MNDSFQNRFELLKEMHPELGDVLHMYDTVLGQHYSKGVITKYFNKLVSKEEYDKSDKQDILEYLFKATEKPLSKTLGK